MSLFECSNKKLARQTDGAAVELPSPPQFNCGANEAGLPSLWRACNKKSCLAVGSSMVFLAAVF